MGLNTRVTTIAAAVLGGALLAGVGCSPAMAATATSRSAHPRVSAAASGAHAKATVGAFDLVNHTPYTWTLYPQGTVAEIWGSPDGGDHWQWIKQSWDGRAVPPQQVLPGQSVVSLTRAYQGDNRFDLWVSYSFQDGDGAWHLVQGHRGTNGQLTTVSNDWSSTADNWVQSTALFHLASEPGGNGVGAYLNKPEEVTIDAAADPAKAAEIMKQFADGTDPSYTPTADPTWTESNPVQGSARLINATSAEAKLTATTGTTNSETTNLSTEVSWSTKLNILDLANASIGVAVKGGHSFGTSTEVEDGNMIRVEPGRMGWFVKTTQVESVTGDFVFTLNGIVRYHVNNMTVSMPGLVKPGQGIPVPGTAFMPTDTVAPKLPPV